MKTFKIHNTLNNKVENFEPIDSSNVRVYACGPTVYSYAHIGNARMAVVNDLLIRFLKILYPKVIYVSNITDIDDKIIAASKESKIPIRDLTQKFTKIYNEDMAMLGVNLPDIQPKATEHITEMIQIIEKLIGNEFAYEKDGHVLFHVPAFKKYGSLSGRNRDEQIIGSRVEVAPYKKDPTDFILWKPSTASLPGWESPWGFGRPGWHLECSAMSEKTLGLPFDIHSGGADLIFPHHENEIAQSCCSSANIDDPTSYARYWMHNGFVTIDGEKMSKSLGNIILVKDLIEDHHGEVIRLALLSSHYRQGLDWNEKIIHQSKKLLDKLYTILKDLDNTDQDDAIQLNKDVIGPLMDDLNTPGLIAELNKIIKDFGAIKEEEKPAIKSKLIFIGSVLGILNDKNFSEVSEELKNKIQDLIKKRADAKQEKNFEKADEIRQELLDLGVEIKDTSDGTNWNLK